MQREPEYEPLEPLMRATVAVDKFVRELYPPLVSEYVSTILAWQLLVNFFKAMDREALSTQSHGDHPERTSQEPQRGKLRKTCRQLLALRQFCIREGFADAVVGAEEAFDITEATRDEWTKTVDERSSAKQRHWRKFLALKSTSAETAEDRDREWAVRINVWLLQTLKAHPDLANLHRVLHLQIYNAHQDRENNQGSGSSLLNRHMGLLNQLEKTAAGGSRSCGTGSSTTPWRGRRAAATRRARSLIPRRPSCPWPTRMMRMMLATCLGAGKPRAS
jgi:hypothetical protein